MKSVEVSLYICSPWSSVSLVSIASRLYSVFWKGQKQSKQSFMRLVQPQLSTRLCTFSSKVFRMDLRTNSVWLLQRHFELCSIVSLIG